MEVKDPNELVGKYQINQAFSHLQVKYISKEMVESIGGVCLCSSQHGARKLLRCVFVYLGHAQEMSDPGWIASVLFYGNCV